MEMYFLTSLGDVYAQQFKTDASELDVFCPYNESTAENSYVTPDMQIEQSHVDNLNVDIGINDEPDVNSKCCVQAAKAWKHVKLRRLYESKKSHHSMTCH